MQDNEAQQLLLNIINQAQNGKPAEFSFIKTWLEFRFYFKRFRATKIIIRTLKAASKNLFKSYCNDIRSGTTDVTKLFAFAELQEVIEFYQIELATIKNMLEDYDEYLGSGYFWYSFLGGERQPPYVNTKPQGV